MQKIRVNTKTYIQAHWILYSFKKNHQNHSFFFLSPFKMYAILSKLDQIQNMLEPNFRGHNPGEARTDCPEDWKTTDRFEVDRIVGKTITDEGDIYYLVQWKNCKSHHKLTWEKKEHLKGKTKKDEEFQIVEMYENLLKSVIPTQQLLVKYANKYNIMDIEEDTENKTITVHFKAPPSASDGPASGIRKSLRELPKIEYKPNRVKKSETFKYTRNEDGNGNIELKTPSWISFAYLYARAYLAHQYTAIIIDNIGECKADDCALQLVQVDMMTDPKPEPTPHTPVVEPATTRARRTRGSMN